MTLRILIDPASGAAGCPQMRQVAWPVPGDATLSRQDHARQRHESDAAVLAWRQTQVADIDDPEEIGGEAEGSVEEQEEPEKESGEARSTPGEVEQHGDEHRVDRLFEPEVVADDAVPVHLPKHERRRSARMIVGDEAARPAEDPREREGVGEAVDVIPDGPRCCAPSKEQHGADRAAQEPAERRQTPQKRSMLSGSAMVSAGK